ncbi:unnamed protein product [Staurois parvus]|uniref:Uncharacterized protein n=1 Tax=Staurois parvus TaxID=386267 RepID=A0ABN9B2B1_9NEOB|nr:unnamed protein product [Staurois parvus]
MYVKWVETAMKKLKFFNIFKFPAAGSARTSRRHRDRNTEAGCRHRPEEMAKDAAGDTSRERRTR